ncbi:Dimeric dihydrodiol protein [Lasiodiplodia theobromae]|uniref:D-xylose 1-dehydrogenase (NADP(+), D-xylono-1,5-lactone-forming) n=1 Tax=Lasiodiplodia theobromae TaxID=45133 RepID=A0A5N5CUH6_9PEZI|nr:Dimeric dihydrodiol protein [Lasiodiplodia theobromae]KAB2568985.1 D-xylose 1-dehydrogenase (NADP(+)) [Lasiodiplodia theobromae]KAF4540814.1 Dimeric dihydrodiol protein [Lasiodiplodia theobromae]
MAAPKEIRWGILATGAIAKTFTTDLLCDPKTRGVNHIKHTVVAASSSNSVDRAAQFLKDVGAPSTAKAYGSYAEFVKDPNIDIVYVATPHSHHYQNVRLALEAGKNVLCEKAFTVNADQLKKLVAVAKEKNLFLMEAVWTRYFPLSIYVRDIISSGKIGTVQRVYADNAHALDPETAFADGQHRMVNPDLAGGALLDLGIYSLTWVFQTVYTTLPEAERQPPSVLSSTNIYAGTGAADELTTILLNFPRSGGKNNVHAVATTGLRYATDSKGDRDSAGPACRVQGDKGEIQIFPPLYRPTKTRLVLRDGTDETKEWPQPGPGAGSGWYNGFGGGRNAEGEGHGMFWEADEAATALVEGRKEGKYESLAESVTIMEVMDEVRKQAGLKYPSKIETTDYPVAL